LPEVDAVEVLRGERSYALAVAGAAPAKFKLMAVNNMPHSGKPDELVDAFGISARHIVETAKGVL
jgi:transketolase